MSSKVWTPSEIRKLAREQKQKRLEQESSIDSIEDDELVTVEAETNPETHKKSTSRHQDTEVKGRLSYWNQFEESVGNRVVTVMSPQWNSQFFSEDETEIERLCSTLDLEVCDSLVLRSREPDAATYVGSGQLSRIRKALQLHNASALVVDAPLKPSQVKNLEKALKLPVVDREGVILSIFQAHASTRLAQMQVEVAQLKYLLPRLSGVWMGLSRQRGAKGGLGGRGLGETRLELDRRVVKDRINFISKKLLDAEKSFRVQSAKRSQLPRVALVGYTNAGKSTLMQKLTRAPVHIEDKLFATLDTTIRMLNPPTKPQILLSDTVGFVRDLPHDLVASFKSTLAEAVSSRLLLHVLDVSHPAWKEQFETTEKVLEEIGAAGIPKILVLNKSDNLKVAVRLRESQTARIIKEREDYVGRYSISATTGEGIESLKEEIRRLCGAEVPEWIKEHHE
jgi:GTPase